MIPSIKEQLSGARIREFCREWHITEMAVFGSATRDDFGPDSDVDLLVAFAADARWSLLDLVRAQQVLSDIIGRRVDLVERSAVERSPNPIRRNAILGSAVPVYVAG